MMAIDDLRLLRTFVRIADSGSISAAARDLNAAQPTISRQLRQLEKSSGVILLHRDTHTMSLTAAGERLLYDARELLSLAEVTSERLRADRETIRGHLRVVAVLDSGQWMVSRLLAEFRQLHPLITAELHLTNRPSKFIKEGFDCGILVGPSTDTSVAAKKAGEMRRALVAAPALLAAMGTPTKIADLKLLPWMGIVQPHFFIRDRIPLRRGKVHRVVKLSPVLLMDGVTALREAAIAGAGMTVLPEWLMSDALREGRLVRLLPGWTIPPVDVHVVFPTGPLPGRVRALIDYSTEHFPRLVAEFSGERRVGGR